MRGLNGGNLGHFYNIQVLIFPKVFPKFLLMETFSPENSCTFGILPPPVYFPACHHGRQSPNRREEEVDMKRRMPVRPFCLCT